MAKNYKPSPWTQDIEPPTPAQIRRIAQLSAALGIPEPRVETMAEAGRMIRELGEEVKYRRKKQ